MSYDKNISALSKTYPLSTTSISNNSDMICIIVIDGKGKFYRTDKIEKANHKQGIATEFVTIPASEESLKRTSTAILPYPVFEQFGYLHGIIGMSNDNTKKFYKDCGRIREEIKELQSKKNHDEKRLKLLREYKEKNEKLEAFGKKYDSYLAQLEDFAKASKIRQVEAICQYIAGRTIDSDLSGVNIKDSTYVLFQVEIPGEVRAKLWEDETFFKAWHQYYWKEIIRKKNIESLDYISGAKQSIATFHPKKIFNASANAKLISANDKTNYTFRGKFEDSSQAVSVGYETSQKAHQFLRYLIKNRGCVCGEQVIFSFTIDINRGLLPPPLEDESIYAIFQVVHTRLESDIKIELNADTGFDYAEALKKSIDGFKYDKTLEQHARTAVIALDAVSDKSGRLSITFYRELDRTEYLEKIADWHEGCKWNQQFWDNENKKFVPYTGAPSVDKIIEVVYGKPRGGSDESYTKIKKAARERLLRCIFDGAFLPKDYVVSAVRRASNPLSITKNNKFDRNGFKQIVSTACALVRKDYKQYNKEEFKLSIELNRTDRDYLYGRLLGAADELEEYALRKQGNDRMVTAAIRHMQAFAQRPFGTWTTIYGCLNPYIQKVKGGFAFKEIQTVKQLFLHGEFEKNTPLNGSYLLGYYHERAYIESLVKTAIDKKKSNSDNKKENSNDE